MTCVVFVYYNLSSKLHCEAYSFYKISTVELQELSLELIDSIPVNKRLNHKHRIIKALLPRNIKYIESEKILKYPNILITELPTNLRLPLLEYSYLNTSSQRLIKYIASKIYTYNDSIADYSSLSDNENNNNSTLQKYSFKEINSKECDYLDRGRFGNPLYSFENDFLHCYNICESYNSSLSAIKKQRSKEFEQGTHFVNKERSIHESPISNWEEPIISDESWTEFRFNDKTLDYKKRVIELLSNGSIKRDDHFFDDFIIKKVSLCNSFGDYIQKRCDRIGFNEYVTLFIFSGKFHAVN